MSGRRRLRQEQGVATLVLPMLLWIGTLAGIALVDVGAYLVAASRAQSLADAGALAVVASVQGSRPVDQPIREADRVVVAGGGQLEACTCVAGADQATVQVSMPVPGLVIPRLGAARVTAQASAMLVEPWP